MRGCGEVAIPKNLRESPKQIYLVRIMKCKVDNNECLENI